MNKVLKTIYTIIVLSISGQVMASSSVYDFDTQQVINPSSLENSNFKRAVQHYEGGDYTMSILSMFPIFRAKYGFSGTDALLEDCYALCYLCHSAKISSGELLDSAKLVEMNRKALALDYFSRASDSKTRSLAAIELALETYEEALTLANSIDNKSEVNTLLSVVGKYRGNVDMRIELGQRVLTQSSDL